MTSREAIISFTDSDLIDLIPSWVDGAAGAPLGLPVSEALELALRLRARVAAGDPFRLDASTEGDMPDVLYAVSRLLMDDCVLAPRRVLEEASAIWEMLNTTEWLEDDLDERKGLLCALSFVAWRAARLLDISQATAKWEGEYKRAFRSSLHWDITEAELIRDSPTEEPATERAIFPGEENVFQTLLYLQEKAETDPQAVAERAIRLHDALESSAPPPFSPDLQQYFLGESARVAAAVLRGVAPEDASDWLDLAEDHFRAGVNPEPQLARVLFIRLTLLYALTRCDLVIEKGPGLDSAFASLGMEEDRVKCRLVWAGSLKLMGRCQEALAVLEPVRQARSLVRPALFGWVLLQAGDIQQMCGDHERALQDLLEAALLLRQGKQFTGLADAYSMISCVYRAQGRLDEAMTLLEIGRQDHARLGMKWPEAYHRILIAETYLAMGRAREAEAEIRAALPILEEQGMLADAVIAVNLLREAVRQRKLNPADDRESKPNT